LLDVTSLHSLFVTEFIFRRHLKRLEERTNTRVVQILRESNQNLSEVVSMDSPMGNHA